MSLFELQFQIQPVSEDILDDVIATVDSGYASHGNIHLLTVWMDAETGIDAALSAAGKLEDLGVEVVKLYEDLVTRQDIADRTSTTRQAVGNWIRQERRVTGNSAFPDPFNIVGGGVWLWSDVNQWLAQVGKDDGLSHPTASDYALFNATVFDRSPSRDLVIRFATGEPLHLDSQAVMGVHNFHFMEGAVNSADAQLIEDVASAPTASHST